MKRKWYIAWALTILFGTLLHDLYDWFPNPLTALISPVNESVWEHMKLLFWPYLAAAWILVQQESDPWQAWSGHLLSLLVMPLSLLGVYYTLDGGLEISALWIDLLLYVLAMAEGFALACHAGRGKGLKPLAPVLLLLVCLYAVLLTLFTFAAPALPLFLPAG